MLSDLFDEVYGVMVAEGLDFDAAREIVRYWYLNEWNEPVSRLLDML